MVFLVPSLTEPYPKTFGWPGPWARHHHPTSVPNIHYSVSVLQIKGLWYRWTAFEPGFMLASFLLVSLVIVQQMNTINTYQRPKIGYIGYMPIFFFIKCILNNLILCDSAFKTLRDSQNVAFFFFFFFALSMLLEISTWKNFSPHQTDIKLLLLSQKTKFMFQTRMSSFNWAADHTETCH